MKLNQKQTTARDLLLDNETNEVLFGGAAGGGKSILGCFWQIRQRLKHAGTRGLIGRAKLKTLKETTLVSFFKVAKMQGLINKSHYTINNQSNIITFYNKSEILLKDLFYYPSDPNFDELGSLEITDAFIDEVPQITEKAWNIVRSRIRHGLDENNLIPKILGTCNPSKNFVYHRFYKPFKNNQLPPERKFIQSFVNDNPDISRHYISNLESLDQVSKERLLYGNWEYDSDPATLILYEKTVDLFVNNHVISGLKFITCDVARLGNDKTIIRIWDGLRSIHKVVLLKSRINEIVDCIRALQVKFSVPNSNTIVDEDGVGGGVVDYLKCKGFVNNSKPLEELGEQKNYQNLRSQCYFKLAECINSNNMYLSDNDITDRENITQELEQIKQKDIDSDGKLTIIPRDQIHKNIERSPDEASCLMMRMFFEIKPNAIHSGHKIIISQPTYRR